MQLMSCAKGAPDNLKSQPLSFYAASKEEKECGFIPIEKAQKILLPQEDLCYNWAYTSGAPGTYYVFTVNDSDVNVKLCSPGKGVVREFHWETPNEIVDITVPEPPAEDRLTNDDFMQISKAKLH